MATNRWWRGAVIYQIYPRSFMDTNADGVGDLPGIVEKLEYIASLGVDAIWISPFLRNGKGDFDYHGYAATDFYKVDPRFGSLEDLQRLVREAQRRAIISTSKQ